jgi:hypothetical protein
MDILEAHRHRLICETGYKLINILQYGDLDVVKKIIDESQFKVNSFNWSNEVCIDKTNSEIGNFISGCRRTIFSFFKENDFISKEAFDSCDVFITDFTEDGVWK